MPLRSKRADQKQQNRLSGGHQRYVLNDAYANPDSLSSAAPEGPWSAQLHLPNPAPAAPDHYNPDRAHPPSLGATRKKIATVDAAGDFDSLPGRGIGSAASGRSSDSPDSVNSSIASPVYFTPNSKSPRSGGCDRSPPLMLVLAFIVGAAVGVGVVALSLGGLNTESPGSPAPPPATASTGGAQQRLVVTFPLEFDSLTETGRQQVIDQVVDQARAKAAAAGLTVAATDIASTAVSAGSVVITVTFGPAVNVAMVNAMKTAGSAESTITGPAGAYILVGLPADAWDDGAGPPSGTGNIQSTSVTGLDLANEVRARDEVISVQTAAIANHTATISALQTALSAATDRLAVLEAAAATATTSPVSPQSPPSSAPSVAPATSSPVTTHTPTTSPSTTAPTVLPITSVPTDRPSSLPIGGPITDSPLATHTPTATPTTGAPTTTPITSQPSARPTSSPTGAPATPSPVATHTPTTSPTSSAPNLNPTNSAPTPTPNSAAPTQWPSISPSTLRPTGSPTGGPATTIPTSTHTPTAPPTTSAPTAVPSSTGPTADPTLDPTASPLTESPISTHTPTDPPTTSAPTAVPSSTGPTADPTSDPTASPLTESPISTHTPTAGPTTSAPTAAPDSSSPTRWPSVSPSTLAPTSDPTATLTLSPTAECVCPPVPVQDSCSPTTVTHTPTFSPSTSAPTAAPTFSTPSVSPITPSPTTPPSVSPTESASPTAGPSQSPTPRYLSFPALTAGGFSVIRLPAQTREGGTNQTLWYRDLCLEYGLRPVMCQLNEDYGLGAGTDYDLSGHPWNAVGLPQEPFECDFSSNDAFIGVQTGWSNVVGYYRRAGSSCTWTSRGVTSTNGCLYQGFRTLTTEVYPLCTNYTGS